MKPKFIHLCVQSDFSINSGLNKPSALVKQANILRMPALGITDYGNFYGIVKFYQSAMKYGIKPIFGVKFKLFSKFNIGELSEINILASNYIGYKNIILLISQAHNTKYKFSKYKEDIIISQEWLIRYREGLIILSAGCLGNIGKCIINKNYNMIEKFIDFYKKYFPREYYFEIHRNNKIYEEKYIKYIIKLSILHHIPIVATNNVCFINKNDFYAHKIRVCINQGVTLHSEKSDGNYSTEQYMKSEKQMFSLFSDIPESLKNSVEIAKRCNVIIPSGSYFIPSFPTKSVHVKNLLVQKSIQGMQEKLTLLYLNKKKRNRVFFKYQNRLLLELNIINKMNFSGYFLIVMEFIQWAKDNNIPVGPGRGSGAGSLVAFCLKITALDPLFFDLLFERFLNPKRSSMPDFDIDFCMEKRDLVIEHVINFYGKKKVAQIMTFGTMTARAVIRDVGRVLGYPYGFVNKISQLIPLDIGITLEKSLSEKFALLKLYNNNIEVRRLIDISKKLEGVIRNTGKHAGGIVIAPNILTNFTPIEHDDNGTPITQFDKYSINYIGLLKFDFLGLRTLTIINAAFISINKYLKKNNKKEINLDSINLDDKKSFMLLKKAETIGVFQLESYGMRDLILKLQPDSFEDIISLIALFRPGPLQSGMVDNFINRKKGKEPICYPDYKWQHDSLKPILQSTYGIILYQEQVMQIAQVLSGYSLSKADILQRAMSKKNTEEMLKQRNFFQNSAQKKGISYKLSSKIFDLLEKFSGYGFNKSHSAAYALISYQTLWLKSNYPSEFMISVMNADIDNTDKIKILIQECFRMQLKIIYPNINICKYFFTVNKNGDIVYGLGAIKGVGKSVVQTILEARNKVHIFNSIFDFCILVNSKCINKRVLEKLIFSGSFDVFQKNRSILIYLIPTLIKLSSQYNNCKDSNQLELFSPLIAEKKILQKIEKKVTFPPLTKKNQLDYEKDVLGFYLTGNPLEEYIDELNFYTNNIRIKNIYHYKKMKLIKFFGISSYVRFKSTKNNKNIVFLEVIDGSEKIEIIIFNKVIDKCRNILIKDNILIIQGYFVSHSYSKKLKFIASDIMDLNIARNKYVKKVILLIQENINYDGLLNDIKKLVKPFLGGTIPIYISYKHNNKIFNFKMHNKWNIKLNDLIINKLKLLLGEKSVYLYFQ